MKTLTNARRTGEWRSLGWSVAILMGLIAGGQGAADAQETLTLQGQNPKLSFDDNVGTLQMWEIHADDLGFDITDFTAAKTPFTIIKNAPTASLFVAGSGNIGLGTATPLGSLHLLNTTPGSSTDLVIQDSNVGDKPGFRIRSASALNDWTFNTDSAGNFQINSERITGGPELQIRESNGNVTVRKNLIVQTDLTVQRNLNVQGTLTKAAGTFKIDHPVDPENKYLSHSFVESPEMMNIYRGSVRLDERGEAMVTLPSWFDALNREFEYQLTAIGKPAPGVYVAEEVSGNKFKIAGGPAQGKVSWQVTGVRHDAYAKAHPTPVEENKQGSERGRYIHPEAFGKPSHLAIQHEEPSPHQTTAAVTSGK